MAEEVGDITTKWDERGEVVQVRSWVRSPRQNLFTGFKEDFRIHIPMERIKVDAAGEVIGRQDVCELFTRASDCATDPELAPHAMAIQEHLTALTGILWKRHLASTNKAETE